MRNRTYGGVRGRETKVGRKLLRFPPTRFLYSFYLFYTAFVCFIQLLSVGLRLTDFVHLHFFYALEEVGSEDEVVELLVG